MTGFASVVVVNYNGRHFLGPCLDALAAQTLPRHRFEVVVVDNGSADGSAEFLRTEYPWVRAVAAGRNLGFADGNTRGFAAARGEFLVLLNNDTVPARDWLRALLDAAGRHPDAAGVASKLVFHDDPGTINSAGLVPYRDGRGGDRGAGEPDRGQYDAPAEVFGGCGAALLLRRAALDAVGGFDGRLFMYYEDLDLCWRARLSGWRFVYEPAAVVRHVHCGSAGRASPFLTFHVERNRVLVNLKNAPLPVAGWNAVGQWLRLGRAAWRHLRGSATAHPAAHARALASTLRLAGPVAFDRYAVRAGSRVTDGQLARFVRPAPRHHKRPSVGGPVSHGR